MLQSPLGGPPPETTGSEPLTSRALLRGAAIGEALSILSYISARMDDSREMCVWGEGGKQALFRGDICGKTRHFLAVMIKLF